MVWLEADLMVPFLSSIPHSAHKKVFQGQIWSLLSSLLLLLLLFRADFTSSLPKQERGPYGNYYYYSSTTMRANLYYTTGFPHGKPVGEKRISCFSGLSGRPSSPSFQRKTGPHQRVSSPSCYCCCRCHL